MYTPQTEVRLLNTPLSLGDEHQIKFSDVAAQSSYFLGCARHTFLEFLYQRKDDVIKVPMNIDQLYDCNYVMYKNARFSNKYFYAYITKLEWLSDNTTGIHIKTDVYQTWQFDLTFNKSYIERQHPTTDNYNTLADVPPHGQYVEADYYEFNFNGGYFVFCSSDPTQDTTTDSAPQSFKITNDTKSYSIPAWVVYFDEDESDQLNTFIQHVANKGRGDRIVACVYAPFIANKSYFTTAGQIHMETSDLNSPLINVLTGMTNGIDGMSGVFNFAHGQTPSFKKSLTYPYAKIVLTDTASGLTTEYSPEKFLNSNGVYDGNAYFEIFGTISETPTYRATPLYYSGQAVAHKESLVVRCNTSLATVNNLYAKYLMQNGELNTLNRIDTFVSTAAGMSANMAIGNESGALMAGISGLTSMARITAQENQAAKLGNQITRFGDGAMERLCFYNSIKCSIFMMDDDHTNKAEKFWEMYGYPVQAVETPNLTVNPFNSNFNYIKMIKPNIQGGNVPQEDMKEIEDIFSQGITLWHTTAGFKQY